MLFFVLNMLSSISNVRVYLFHVFVFFLLIISDLVIAQCNLLCNTDFENNQVTSSVGIFDASLVPCWQTTASDNKIEVWGSGFNGVPSYSGNQFIELNAYMVSTLFQNFSSTPGTLITISFAHRGRAGIDTMSLGIGPVGGPYNILGVFADDNIAWGYYTLSYILPSGVGTNFSLRFNSIYASGGNPGIGNFLDAVSVTQSGNLNIAFTSTPVSCGGVADGSAQAFISNGVAPFTYTWLPSGGSTSIANSLSVGTYSLLTTSSNGCVASGTIAISKNENLISAISLQNVNCDNTILGNATISVFGGTAPYTFIWEPIGGGGNSAINLQVGNYTVTVSDNNNCRTIKQFTITQSNVNSTIKLPNVFTPNNDGVNDELNFEMDDCELYSVTIFNRWGTKIFFSEDINAENWKGNELNGNEVSDGLYFYIIESKYKKYTGTVTVFR